MNALSRILALAAFESRLSRRMIRVWVLGLLAVFIGLLLLGHRLGIHYYGGGWSGSYAYMTKDLAIQNSVLFLSLLLSLFGIFYVFDWRHRETDARFADTLDTSALTRLEHAWGKFLGLCAGFVVPFLLLLPFQIFAHLFWDLQVPLQVYFLSYFVFAPIFLLVPVALAFGVAGWTGSRALSILVGLAWLALVFILLGFTGNWAEIPELAGMILAGLGGQVVVWSDFTGYSFGLQHALMFVGSFLLAGGFVCLGAAGNFAPTSGIADTRRRWLITLACFGGWALVNAWVALDYLSATQERRDIIAAERAVADAPMASVVRRDLDVKLEPGKRRLSGIAALSLRNDTDATLERLHFRLNAGLEVAGVSGAAGFERDHTVLTVTLAEPLVPGAERKLTIEYAGGIEASSIDAPEEVFTRESKSVFLRNLRRFLGRAPAYLEPSIVVFGTDAAWYPDPAMQFGLDYPAQPRPSFATSHLSVDLPEGWVAASAGSRTTRTGGYDFETTLSVPALSLNAGRFEEVATEVGGKIFRLLYHPDHSRNVEFFAEAAPIIRAEIAERLESIRVDAGLRYPLPELTVVEVPQYFAGFSTGWAAPNRLAAPGVVMAREGQLFGGRFEFPLKQARGKFKEDTGGGDGGIRVSVNVGGETVASKRPEPETETEGEGEKRDEEGEESEEGEQAAEGEDPAQAEESAADEESLSVFDEAQAKYDILARFLGTDWTGGDIEHAALKSAWDFRSRAVGKGAPIAGLALNSYLSELALGRPSVETPEVHRMFTNNDGFGRLIQATARGQNDQVAEIVVSSLTDMDEVYEQMQRTPLAGLDPAEEPGIFLGVMFLKGRGPLKALRATMGRERFNAATASLLREHEGGEHDWDDFRAAFLAEVEPEKRTETIVLFENWLDGTALPGFVVTHPVAVRLAGEQERWQVTATVANRGTAPGTATFTAGRDEDASSQLVSLQVGEEKEIGLVVPGKPRSWTLAPYLALNRTPPQGSFDLREEPEEREPFEGVRPAEVLGLLEPVVVDNVDPGFTVTLSDGREVAWDAQDGDDPELTQLPAFGIFRKPKEWSRWRSQAQWYRPYGLFDVTAAVKRATEAGGQPAHWRASLPEVGIYRVEAYMPPSKGPVSSRMVPKWHFVIRGSEGEREVLIETDAAQDGWNDLGRFRFELDGEVELEDRGESGIVIADAVRFVKEAS